MPIHPSHSTPHKRVRSFIAVDVGPSVRRALRPVIEELRRQNRQVNIRWTPEENWHLTVKFLGDIDWLATGDIGKAMREIASTIPAFELDITGLFGFPPQRNPRVVAAGITAGHECLADLHRRLDERMIPFGVDPEHRAFRAHLTLARVRGTHGAEGLWEGLKLYAERSFGSASIEELTLFQSELLRQGSTYTPLATASLA